MKLKGDPKFDIKNISPLWASKIAHLRELKLTLPESVLVAFDIESSVQGISEIGLAFLRASSQSPQFHSDGGTQSFYVQNQVQAHSIQIRNRISKSATRETTIFGDTLLIDIEEIDTVFKNVFSNYTDKLILVGFDIYSEFNWMSQECPSLSSYFTAWIDIQEIASERSGRSEDIRLSLSDTLRALNIKDWHKKSTQHLMML